MLMEWILYVSCALVIYHHFAYPIILRLLASAKRRQRTSDSTPPSTPWPSLTIIMPAFQEAAFIVRKIDNVAAIEYPRDRLKIIIGCDGCTDGTDVLAHRAIVPHRLEGLDIQVISYPNNRGKVAILNELIAKSGSDIVVLSDVSAMLPADAAEKTARHFAMPDVGVVSGTYTLLEATSGERAYWDFQTKIKADEGIVAAPMGAHGAFYAFRRDLASPLQADIINDDFVLPMRIIAAGYRGIYDPSITAIEFDPTNARQDFRRRVRIGAGNLQQALYLWRLADPRRPGLAFLFLSGKGLRPFMPFAMLTALVASVVATLTGSWIGAVCLIGQAALYGTALAGMRASGGKAAKLGYLVAGHVASMIGALRYMAGLERGRWDRIQAPDNEVPFINPVAAAGKRLADIVIASITLAILALLFIPLAAAIKLDSPGPVLYRQIRVGRRTPSRSDFFHLIKLRTMRTDAESATGPVWATAGDLRVTRVGRFLRKSRLDELPQCINVLKGEMSIVGPRPERPAFFARLEREIPFYAERTFGLRPGITGLAQIKQGYDASIEDVRMKVLWDHVYAMRLASRFEWIKTDVGIILKTAVVMVTKRGSEPDASPMRGRAMDREVA